MTQQPASRLRADAGPAIFIRALATDELGAATTLLAEGMRDNPLHINVFGGDAQRRQQRLQRFLGHLVRYVQAHGILFAACLHGELVGVLGVLPPGQCRPTRMEALRMASAMIVSHPPTAVWRIQRWLSVWARNDLLEPHAHMGPLVVAPAWRRRGVGRELMRYGCRQVDALGVAAWLETDLAINVAFYETLGFDVTRREAVLGVPNWFMRRGPMSVVLDA